MARMDADAASLLNALAAQIARHARMPHSDAAGEVEAVGADVTRFRVGERVMNYGAEPSAPSSGL